MASMWSAVSDYDYDGPEDEEPEDLEGREVEEEEAFQIFDEWDKADLEYDCQAEEKAFPPPTLQEAYALGILIRKGIIGPFESPTPDRKPSESCKQLGLFGEVA